MFFASKNHLKAPYSTGISIFKWGSFGILVVGFPTNFTSRGKDFSRSLLTFPAGKPSEERHGETPSGDSMEDFRLNMILMMILRREIITEDFSKRHRAFNRISPV